MPKFIEEEYSGPFYDPTKLVYWIGAPSQRLVGLDFADVAEFLRTVENLSIIEPFPKNISRFYYPTAADKKFKLRVGRLVLKVVLVKRTYRNNNTAIIVYADYPNAPFDAVTFYAMLSVNTTMAPLPEDVFVCSATPKAKKVLGALLQSGAIVAIGKYDKHRPICELVINPESADERHPGVVADPPILPQKPKSKRLRKRRISK